MGEGSTFSEWKMTGRARSAVAVGFRDTENCAIFNPAGSVPVVKVSCDEVVVRLPVATTSSTRYFVPGRIPATSTLTLCPTTQGCAAVDCQGADPVAGR